MSCPVGVVQLRLWTRLTEKKGRASALLQGNWSLSVFASRYDDCQKKCFFQLREEASRKYMRYQTDFGNKLSINRRMQKKHSPQRITD